MRLEDLPRIGTYRLLLRLGQGAMGDVHLALSEGVSGFAKLSVLKVLRRHLSDDRDFLAMFLEEGRLATRLAHPNIVQTYEVGSDGQSHYLAMEHLDGQTLSSLLNRFGRDNPKLDFAVHAQVLVEVLAAMEYAHECLAYDGSPLCIIHRDLSPPNVFVTYDGRVKVLDFGIAKALDTTIDTKTGLILGKTAYMAPEQARGRELDARADLYAIGVMLWEAVAGRRRWEGTAEPQVLARIASDEIVELPGAVRRGLPARVDEIVARALAPNPADRYPTARAFREDLESVLAELGHRGDLRELGRVAAETFQGERERVRRELERMLEGYEDFARARVSERITSRPLESDEKIPSIAPPPPSRKTSLSPVTTGAHRRPRLGERRRLLTGFALFAVVCAGGLYAFRQSPPSPNRTTAAAPSAQTIRIRVDAFPRSATLYLDGERLGGNPAEVERVVDAREHSLLAVLAGYEPTTRVLRFQNNTVVSVDLRPAPASGDGGSALMRANPAPADALSPKARVKRNENEVDKPRQDGVPSPSSPVPKPPASVQLDLGHPW